MIIIRSKKKRIIDFNPKVKLLNRKGLTVTIKLLCYTESLTGF